MVVKIRHATVTTGTDAGNGTIRRPEWLEDHTVTGLGTAATLFTGTAPYNVLQLDGSARLPAADASLVTNIIGTETLITGPVSVGTGTTFDITSIPTTYRMLKIVARGLSHNDTVTSQHFTTALSGDNGSSWSTLSRRTDIVANTNAVSYFDVIFNASDSNFRKFWKSSHVWYSWNYSPLTAVNAIRFGISGTASFDGGTITLFGVN